MSNTEQVKQESNDSHGIGERVREHLPVGLVTLERRARAQWIAIPTHMRSAVDELLARVRRSLDLPSRTDIDELATRIADLDRKLAELQSVRATKPTPIPEPKPEASATAEASAKPEASTKSKAKGKAKAKAGVANKTARRDKIKRAAADKKRKR